MTESQKATHAASHAFRDGVRRSGEANTQVSERGAEAGAKAMRPLDETTAEVTRRDSEAVVEGQQRPMESAVEHFEEAARSVARTVRNNAEDLRVAVKSVKSRILSKMEMKRERDAQKCQDQGTLAADQVAFFGHEGHGFDYLPGGSPGHSRASGPISPTRRRQTR